MERSNVLFASSKPNRCQFSEKRNACILISVFFSFFLLFKTPNWQIKTVELLVGISIEWNWPSSLPPSCAWNWWHSIVLKNVSMCVCLFVCETRKNNDHLDAEMRNFHSVLKWGNLIFFLRFKIHRCTGVCSYMYVDLYYDECIEVLKTFYSVWVLARF